MRIILHEGKDDKRYLKKICAYLDIKISDENFYEMGNKSNFFKKDCEVYRYKITDPRVEKILFILDADYEKDNKIYGGFDNSKK